MSLVNVQTILEQRLEAIWAAQTNIFWDNTKQRQDAAYICPTLDQLDDEPLGIGCSREIYQFTIQVIVRKDIGSKLINEYSDLLVTSFRNYASGNLLCKEALSVRAGNEEEWFQRNVEITVQFDQYS